MYFLDISDIMFLIKCLKIPSSAFKIKNCINFISGGSHLATSNKLQHNRNSNVLSANFYFNRLPRIWNALPIINGVATIKRKLINYFWNHFEINFDPNNTCTYSFLCPCSKCNKNPTPPNFDTL